MIGGFRLLQPRPGRDEGCGGGGAPGFPASIYPKWYPYLLSPDTPTSRDIKGLHNQAYKWTYEMDCFVTSLFASPLVGAEFWRGNKYRDALEDSRCRAYV